MLLPRRGGPPRRCLGRHRRVRPVPRRGESVRSPCAIGCFHSRAPPACAHTADRLQAKLVQRVQVFAHPVHALWSFATLGLIGAGPPSARHLLAHTHTPRAHTAAHARGPRTQARARTASSLMRSGAHRQRLAVGAAMDGGLLLCNPATLAVERVMRGHKQAHPLAPRRPAAAHKHTRRALRGVWSVVVGSAHGRARR